MLPRKADAVVVDMFESDSYRTFRLLRRLNEELLATNKALQESNRILLAFNEDLRAENVEVLRQVARLKTRA